MRATIGGSGAKTLTLVGGAFAANRNVKTSQDALSDVLSSLRFRRIQYKWYAGADEYSYYDLKTPDDGDVFAY